MFPKIKNLETAFQHVRTFCIVIVIAAFATIGFMHWQNRILSLVLQKRVYILAGNTAWAATAAEKSVYLPYEAKGQVRAFHDLFFNLDPDEKLNRRNLSRALDLADESARKVYDSLSVSGYYTAVVAGNIHQRILIDSVEVDTRQEPYHFRCFARLQITRATSEVVQNLVTEGDLYEAQRSDNNLLGLLIRHWNTTENKVLTVSNH
ncbi:conjugative transposon protein TraK [Mucilaginibacter angelicae]|uniref:Conjugative transposon protein TraK n=1 Tax=Mucilaginibacter angelicae TaxID=869718 RepID=A0ABV6L599_9SPHI